MSSSSRGILSNYKISSILGKGTFSTVKLAKDIRTNEEIAIKILEKNKIKSTRDYNRINREIDIVKNISHINIVQVYEIKEDTDKYYILMEYCERGELFDLILSKRHLSEEDSAYYFYQLVNGLEYIHINNIIHRDLKPENLLLTKNNLLKIIDFGLSNYNPKDNLLSTPCGSPCYASPEMVSGKKYNGFTNDVWSMGIILYAMIYGYLPFENVNNNNDILFQKIRECKVDYPKNRCLLALDLLKKILVPDCDKRITIKEIKKHDLYLKGKNIFRRKHKDINIDEVENRILNNGLRNNIKHNRIKKSFKKFSNSEFSSMIYDFYDNESNLIDKNNFNNNITDNTFKKTEKKYLNRRNINNISPENKKNNYLNNKYYIKSQNKNRQISSIDKNNFSILSTNYVIGRETFSYNINNNTDLKINSKNIQREKNYIPLSTDKVDKTDRLSKTKFKPRNIIMKEKLYPSSHKINFSDKFPDLNSLSMENDVIKEPIINEPLTHNKRKKQNFENYCTSEIKKMISDKNKINTYTHNKEIKPISVINIRPKKALKINTISPDKKEINMNFRQKYGINRIKLESKNNENIKTREKIYLNNDYLNKSNEKIENNKYNNITHISNSSHINTNEINDKFFNNINASNLRAKYSEDKINNKASYYINKRTDTSIGRNNYLKNNKEIMPNQNTRQKKLSYIIIQTNNKNNYASITNNIRRKIEKRYNNSNIKEQEESIEKGKEESSNYKNKIYYSKKFDKKEINKYNINNRQYENQKTEKNKRNHEIYTYIHKNTNEIKDKNNIMNNNYKYQVNNYKEKEEISKINNSYENDIRYDKNSRVNNKFNININKLRKSNLPSITIDMNILNMNNNKYLKLYNAIKNKL